MNLASDCISNPNPTPLDYATTQRPQRLYMRHRIQAWIPLLFRKLLRAIRNPRRERKSRRGWRRTFERQIKMIEELAHASLEDRAAGPQPLQVAPTPDLEGGEQMASLEKQREESLCRLIWEVSWMWIPSGSPGALEALWFLSSLTF